MSSTGRNILYSYTSVDYVDLTEGLRGQYEFRKLKYQTVVG